MSLDQLKAADLRDYKDFPIDTRPSWDSWFMTMCFIVSQRSLDKHTKCGCVVVDSSRSILCVGYNSPPRGCPDSTIPLDRPLKYNYMAHSEANAIANAASTGTSLKGSTFYITGPPCCGCFAAIVNVGAVKIIQGPILHQRNQDEINAIELMNSNKLVEVIDFSAEDEECTSKWAMDEVFELMSRTARYIGAKLESQNEEKNS